MGGQGRGSATGVAGVVLAAAVGACVVDLSGLKGADIACDRDAQCPAQHYCDLLRYRCVPDSYVAPEAAIQVAPATRLSTSESGGGGRRSHPVWFSIPAWCSLRSGWY